MHAIGAHRFNFCVRQIVYGRGVDVHRAGRSIENYSAYNEPVNVMFVQPIQNGHVIMETHYKMRFSSSTEKGIVFAVLEITIIAIEAVAMGFLRRSALGGKSRLKLAALGMAGYALVGAVFREVLTFAPLAKANSLWDAGSIVLVTLLGKFVYGETYSRREWLGVGFAVAAVLCMIGPTKKTKKI